MTNIILAWCMFFSMLAQLFSGICGTPKAWELHVEAEYGQTADRANIIVNLDKDWSNKSIVDYIGRSGTETDNTLTFPAVWTPADGFYTLEVFYVTDVDDRYFDININDSTLQLFCQKSGDNKEVASASLPVYLHKGRNRIVFGSDWYAPSLDRFTLTRRESPTVVFSDGNEHLVVCGKTSLVLDTNNGIWGAFVDEKQVLDGSDAAVRYNGELLTASSFTTHTVEESPLTDDFGTGTLVTFTHTGEQNVTLRQIFRLYEEREYFLTELVLEGDDVSTNYMAPVRTYTENGLRSPAETLDTYIAIPYDNDDYGIVPAMKNGFSLGESHELTALLSSQTNAAVVTGSVTHDTWKTGIDFFRADGNTYWFTVYAGAADVATQDRNPHGEVTGNEVHSSLIFFGWFEDWRDGFDTFAAANTTVVPAKESVSDKVPFGFNSWGVLNTSVSYSDMCAISDYIADNLQAEWEAAGGAVYVNIDSFWDFMLYNEPNADPEMSLDDALSAFTAHCRQNGQKAGIYMTPFTCWHNTEEDLKNSVMPGTNGQYTFYDAALKNRDGSLFGRLDNGWALDPTHPGTRANIKYQIDYFISLGFQYVKLDFMTHGSVEGAHYDKTITTGTQAYNSGMQYLTDCIAGRLFVNLSIAPIFPYQYADGRRLSCDTYYGVDACQHLLRSVSYCFWEKQLYNYPDPDHLIAWGKDGSVTLAQARARATTGVISGTSFLTADNYAALAGNTDEAEARIAAIYGNTEICALAAKGKIFRPVNADKSQPCASLYYLWDDGTLYLALFNFEDERRTFTIPLNFFGEAAAQVRELWSGTDAEICDNTVVYTLEPGDAAVFCCSF